MPRDRKHFTRQQLIGARDGGHRQLPETRIVYGIHCTWWGRVEYASINDQLIPICPNCYGPMLELPDLDHFWAAVKMFEEGGAGFKRPHPGYALFMVWMERRCFKDIILATTMYKASTGVDIDLQPDEFALGGDEE